MNEDAKTREKPQDEYEAPDVEEIDTTHGPAVTAAGQTKTATNTG
jgi:hypothetical protein